MRVFIRWNEILVANVAELVERSEDPARLVRLMIAEIEEAILDARREGQRLEAEAKAARRAAEALDAQVVEWSGKAQFAMTKDRLELARGALTEREKCVDAAAKRRAEATKLDDAIARNAGDVSTLSAKLDEARARQRAIRDDAVASQPAPARPRSRAEAALGRVDVLEQRVAFAEARHGMATPDRDARALEKELDALDLEARVEAALAALKLDAGQAASAGSR